MKLNELYENANYTDDYGMMFNCDIMDLLKNIERMCKNAKKTIRGRMK